TRLSWRRRSRRERPRRRSAAEERDEVAPPHGSYPKAKDHGLSIAGLGAGSGPCITAKAGPYLLTHPGQFDILLFGPAGGDRMPFDQLHRRDFVSLLGGAAQRRGPSRRARSRASGRGASAC